MTFSKFGVLRYHRATFLLICVLLVTGCSKIEDASGATHPSESGSTPWPVVETTVVPTDPSLTSTSTPSATPTPTRILPSATSTVTPTPAIPPEARLNIQCLSVLPDVPARLNLEGMLTFDVSGITWDLKNEVETPLPEPAANWFGLYTYSPNGKWAVTVEFGDKSDKFLVVSADGKVHHSIPIEQGWDGLGPWLNNEMFIFYRDDGKRLWTTVVINPFTGEWREYPSDYPDIYDLDAPRQWGWTNSVYDPTLTRVVYLSHLPDDLYTSAYVIWDLQSNQPIAQIPSLTGDAAKPVWSLDGQQFIIAKPQRPVPSSPYDFYIPDDELYSVSRDGEIINLTNLSAYYTGGIDIRGYVWSPDGRYVAFWMAPNPVAEYHDRRLQLAVLDMETQMVTLYCLQVDLRQGDYRPLWSPNSRQLVMKTLEADGTSRLVVVDVAESVAAQIIAGDAKPLYWPDGWMVSEP